MMQVGGHGRLGLSEISVATYAVDDLEEIVREFLEADEGNLKDRDHLETVARGIVVAIIRRMAGDEEKSGD